MLNLQSISVARARERNENEVEGIDLENVEEMLTMLFTDQWGVNDGIVERTPFCISFRIDPYHATSFKDFGRLLLTVRKRIFSYSDRTKFLKVIAFGFKMNNAQIREARVTKKSIKLGFYIQLQSGTNIKTLYKQIKDSMEQFKTRNPVLFFLKPMSALTFIARHDNLYQPTSRYELKINSFGKFDNIFSYEVDREVFTENLEYIDEYSPVIQNRFVLSSVYSDVCRSSKREIHKMMKVTQKEFFDVLWNGSQFSEERNFGRYIRSFMEEIIERDKKIPKVTKKARKKARKKGTDRGIDRDVDTDENK